MRALLDGVFEAEEGFQEIENDDEFEDKGGKVLLSVVRSPLVYLNVSVQMRKATFTGQTSKVLMRKLKLTWLARTNSKR